MFPTTSFLKRTFTKLLLANFTFSVKQSNNLKKQKTIFTDKFAIACPSKEKTIGHFLKTFGLLQYI